MSTRSGRGFVKDGNPQPPVPGRSSQTRQPAQDSRVTRSSKRKRSSSNTSPSQFHDANASKRPRAGRGRAGNSSQTSTSEIIDLTRDDDCNREDTNRSVYRPTIPWRDCTRAAAQRGRVQKLVSLSDLEEHDGKDWRAQRARSDSRFAENEPTSNDTPKSKQWQSRARNRVKAPAAVVMFTWAEAKRIIESANRARSSPPYTLQTGDYLSYPVTRSYHLGGMGRYGPYHSLSDLRDSRQVDTEYCHNSPREASRSAQQSRTDYVFDWGYNCGKHINEKHINEVSREYITSILSSPRLGQLLEERDGLRTALELYTPHHPRLASFPPTLLTGSLPIGNSAPRPEVSAPNHVTDRPCSSGLVGSAAIAMDGSVDMAPQVYRLPFGRYTGRALAEVPASYLRSLEKDGDVVKNDWEFWEALAHHEVQSYRLDFGRHKGKRLDQVPDDYLVSLEQHAKDFGREPWQRALWYRIQQLGRSNEGLRYAVDRYRERIHIEH
jgi:uncharacterized protein (DUF3820 family)